MVRTVDSWVPLSNKDALENAADTRYTDDKYDTDNFEIDASAARNDTITESSSLTSERPGVAASNNNENNTVDENDIVSLIILKSNNPHLIVPHGTCEALVNGQWIHPCLVNVPSDLIPGQEYVVQVKEVKNKARSSGKFYSVRSFLYGFYNNVLGMVGMVTYKRNAKQNYIDRMEYENLIRQKTMERKRLKALEIAAEQAARQPK